MIVNKKVNVPILLFGGCGGHIGDDLAKEMKDVGFERVNFNINAFNTDAEDLDALDEGIKKVLIGENETGGYGAGADPQIGLAAAIESEKQIMAVMEDADIAIFVAGLGGGTGTGALPYAVSKFKEMMNAQEGEKLYKKKAAIVIVTLPFDSQDAVVKRNAKVAYEQLHELGVPLIPISNDRFWPEGKDLKSIPAVEMFSAGNKPMAHMIGRMVRSLGQRHNQTNIDRNDIVSHLLLTDGQHPLAYYGVGYCKEGEDISVALEMAASNRYQQYSLEDCHKAIISVDCFNPTAADLEEIQKFDARHRKHADAEWRTGFNSGFEPLAFEVEHGYRAAVFVIGVGCEQVAVAEEVANSSIATESSWKVPPPAAPYLYSNSSRESIAKDLPPAKVITEDEVLDSYDREMQSKIQSTSH